MTLSSFHFPATAFQRWTSGLLLLPVALLALSAAETIAAETPFPFLVAETDIASAALNLPVPHEADGQSNGSCGVPPAVHSIARPGAIEVATPVPIGAKRWNCPSCWTQAWGMVHQRLSVTCIEEVRVQFCFVGNICWTSWQPTGNRATKICAANEILGNDN